MEEITEGFSVQIQGISIKYLTYLLIPFFFSCQVSRAMSRAPDCKSITLVGIIFRNLDDLLHPCKGHFTPLQSGSEVPGSKP